MSPPAYADLGKQAKDVFSKGYNYGVLKLDVKTKTESGVEFNSGCTSNQDARVFGNLETKYKIKDLGLTFSEKWNTDNVLETAVTVQDQLAKGLKLSADASFAPQSGHKSGNIKAAFVNDFCALDAKVGLLYGGPIITASAVLGYQGFLGGYQLKFDANNSKITNNNFALGYSHGDFVLHANVNDGTEFGGSIYHKVNSQLDAGVDLQWWSGTNDTKFGIGCKYALDSDASVRAKVNNASEIGLGYQQKLRQGITLTLSSLLDAKNFNHGGHKLGIGLELEA